MTGAGFGYASTLILANAARPAAMRTSRPSMTIARRESADARTSLSTNSLSPHPQSRRSVRGARRRGALRRRRGRRVVQEQRRLGGDQLPGLEPFHDLDEPVLLEADLDHPLDEALAVRRDEDGHRAVTLAQA